MHLQPLLPAVYIYISIVIYIYSARVYYQTQPRVSEALGKVWKMLGEVFVDCDVR